MNGVSSIPFVGKGESTVASPLTYVKIYYMDTMYRLHLRRSIIQPSLQVGRKTKQYCIDKGKY